MKTSGKYFWVWAAATMMVFLLVPPGFADETKLKSFFDNTSGFLVRTVGSGVFLLGLIGAGIKISTGDQNGLKNAIMVTVGGAIIFLAKPILAVLLKLGGGN